jgi:predicted RNA-binding protein with PUA-like domain
MKYWLMKTEPDTFSIDDLKRKVTEPWDGVRNYQARNFMRDGMKVGDKIFFYHSNTDIPGIVGIATVASAAYPDESQFNKKSKYYDEKATREEPRWMLIDVKFERKLARTISLEELKNRDELVDMPLVRKGNRLSVMPVAKSDWDFILTLEKS